MTLNTEALGQAIAAREEEMLFTLNVEANNSIIALNQIIREKDDLIRQYAEKAREDAITIARLRLRCENDAALARAVATRDARARIEAAEYAASMQRTADSAVMPRR